MLNNVKILSTCEIERYKNPFYWYVTYKRRIVMTKIDGFNGDFQAKYNQTTNVKKGGEQQKAPNSLFGGNNSFSDFDNKMSLFTNSQFNKNLKPDGGGRDFGFFDNLKG